MPLDPEGPQACVWLTCALRGQPTTDARCPECGKPTESRADFAGGALFAVDELGATTELIATTDTVPGLDVVDFRGDVVGVVVVSRGVLGNLGAGLQAVGGGEITPYSALLADARRIARRRMWDEAVDCGANAVVGMRYAGSTVGESMIELAAYGTAVVVRRPEPKSTPPANPS